MLGNSDVGLDKETAEKVIKFVEGTGGVNNSDGISITKEGKYKNESVYKCLNICKSNDRTTATLTNLEDISKRLKILAEKLGYSPDSTGNVMTIDISYSNIKDYYNKLKKNTLDYTPCGKEHEDTLKEIEQYFDGESDRKKLCALAKKHLFDIPERYQVDKIVNEDGAPKTEEKEKNVNDPFKQFFDRILTEMLKTDTGLKRIESLLLLKLLSFVKGNPLDIKFIDGVNDASKAKIVVSKGNATQCAFGELYISVNYMDGIDLSSFAIADKDCAPVDRNTINEIRALMINVAKGAELDWSDKLIARGFKILACSVVHELSHAYDFILVNCMLDLAGSSTGAYLSNKLLSARLVPLLNANVREKVYACCQSGNAAPKLARFINNDNRTWAKSFDDAVHREIAREICAHDDPNDMLVMYGVVPIHTPPGKITVLVDYQNENAIRREVGEPYVFGHGRYKFCAKTNKAEAITTQNEVQKEYAPYKVDITVDDGKHKVFEPYVFEEIIGEAVRELKIENVRLFDYTKEPTDVLMRTLKEKNNP
jgi:hypothetical protein